jgi:hypothetical protein
MHAAIRGRAMVFPDPDISAKRPLSEQANGKPTSVVSQANHSQHPAPSSVAKPATVRSQAHTHGKAGDGDGSATPTPSRPQTPIELNVEEERMVRDTLTARTPRTSLHGASILEADIVHSHFHDMDLCVLLQQEADPTVHDVVKKALRKAIRQRIKKLGMQYDHEVRF